MAIEIRVTSVSTYSAYAKSVILLCNVLMSRSNDGFSDQELQKEKWIGCPKEEHMTAASAHKATNSHPK
jgi:hypothetical protein